uniref:Uncharacterized protein n=1 Tax=Salix viminalis TaxID=40686 RepID=A0A6N2L3A3_SALVM
MNLGLLGGQQRRHGVFASHVQSHAGIQEPEIEVKISSTEKFERLDEELTSQETTQEESS